jgi:hypothetical protein
MLNEKEIVSFAAAIRQQPSRPTAGTAAFTRLTSWAVFTSKSILAAEERENFGRDLFSLHRHFAKRAGAILLFRFGQGRAADNNARFVFRCFCQRFKARGEVHAIAGETTLPNKS